MILRSDSRYIVYSFLLHGVVILMLLSLNKIILHQTTKPQVVSLELIDRFPARVVKPKDEDKRKLLVDQEHINDEVDPLAKYLSSHSQRVFKETVAREHGEFQNKKNNRQPMVKLQKQEALRPRPVLVKDLFGSYKNSLQKVIEKKFQSETQSFQEGGETSRSRDYLPETEEGVETLLTTHEFVYYTYYNRIRGQLSQYWEPKIKQKIIALFKRGRRIASTQDHVTKVQIVLDSKGLLIKVQVINESGIQDLDDVAVEAFKAAAPFPNPPKGIIDPDGTVKIQWDFVVES